MTGEDPCQYSFLGSLSPTLLVGKHLDCPVGTALGPPGRTGCFLLETSCSGQWSPSMSMQVSWYPGLHAASGGSLIPCPPVSPRPKLKRPLPVDGCLPLWPYSVSLQHFSFPRTLDMVNSSQLMPLLVKSHSSLQDANLIFFFLCLKNCSMTPVAVQSKWLPMGWQAARSSPVHASQRHVPSSVTRLLLFLPVTSQFQDLYRGHNCFFTDWRSWSREWGVGVNFPPGDSDSLPPLPGQQMGLAALPCSRLAPVRCPRTSSRHLLQCKPLEGRAKLHSTVCPGPTQSWAHYW